MRNIQNFIDNYKADLHKVIDNVPKNDIKEVIEIMLDAYKNDRHIFICGNGGSASTASHFMNDLNKLCNVEGKKRIKALALTDNVPLMTAWANDHHYDYVFVEQLKNLMEKHDICIVISGSGDSHNVIKAVEFANDSGGITIGFLGFDGGKLKDVVHKHVIVNSNHYGLIEDMHHSICHIIANCLRDIIKMEYGRFKDEAV